MRLAEIAGSDRSSEKSDSLPTEPVDAAVVERHLAKEVKQPSKPVETAAKASVKESKQQEQSRKRKEAAVELRRRKQHSNRKDNPSLMKQLLWKVKPVASASPTPAQATEQTSQTNEEDEELAYAAEERHLLKLHASSLTKSMRFPVESSSQETQSGSEDESFIQYGLIPSDGVREGLYDLGSELDLMDVSFPTSLPLDRIESVKLGETKSNVHEILLEDFMFKPAELFIVKGDIVVWRVSEQTLGMVEHSLDATQFDRAGKLVRKVSTPLLSAGSGFAWRFDVAGGIDIQCSVYDIKGVIHINEADDVAEPADVAVKATTASSQRRKKKMSAKSKRAAKLAAKALDAELETRSDSSDYVAVFHPSKDLTRVPEMDAGVCRAVLSQLEEVQAAAEASFIVVGDIACPLIGEQENDSAEPAQRDVDTVSESGNDEVGDFQQRIIAMLQKSEETQVRQRGSFLVKSSSFDAGAAYDFFKRRTCHSLLWLRLHPRSGFTLISVFLLLLLCLQVSHRCSTHRSLLCTLVVRNDRVAALRCRSYYVLWRRLEWNECVAYCDRSCRTI